MNVMTGQRADITSQAIVAALCLLLCTGIAAGCGKKEDAAPATGGAERQAPDGPGSGYMDLKGLWDARQELVAMLSSRLMGVTKLKEYINYAKSGNKGEAEKSKKVYRITVESAEQSRLKLKRMGY